MNIIDAFGKQPKPWMLAEAILLVALAVGFNVFSTTPVYMFLLYAIPVFLIAHNFSSRPAICSAVLIALTWTMASWHVSRNRSVGRFIWTGFNQQCSMLFVAACGISIQRFREATRRRLEALEHAEELQREIVRTSEREQMRIGQDLHDGVCQSLAALDVAAQCLKMDLEKGDAPQAKMAAEIQKQLTAVMLEARHLARGIYPVTMEKDGLSVALQGLVLATKSLTNAKITFESDDNVTIKDAEVAMHVYRIAQEALSNAMRHANASHINVRLALEDRRLNVSVTDDGSGSGIQSPNNGMGLRTMRYRANLIGAKVDVEHPANGGTTVRCLLPIPSRPA